MSKAGRDSGYGIKYGIQNGKIVNEHGDTDYSRENYRYKDSVVLKTRKRRSTSKSSNASNATTVTN